MLTGENVERLKDCSETPVPRKEFLKSFWMFLRHRLGGHFGTECLYSLFLEFGAVGVVRRTALELMLVVLLV